MLMRQMMPVAAGHTIVVAVFAAEDFSGDTGVYGLFSLPPMVPSGCPKLKASEPGKFVVVTTNGVAEATFARVNSLVISRKQM